MAACATAGVFAAFFVLLLAAAVQDIRERKVSNRLVVSMAVLWVVWRLALATCGATYDVVETSMGLLACALILGAALVVFTVVAESIAKRPMFGGADIKLLAVVTLYVGVVATLVALFAACAMALLYAATKSARGIPFAPGILCGTMLAVLL